MQRPPSWFRAVVEEEFDDGESTRSGDGIEDRGVGVDVGIGDVGAVVERPADEGLGVADLVDEVVRVAWVGTRWMDGG